MDGVSIISRKVSQASIDQNQKTPKIHQHGVSSCLLSNIIQIAMSLHKRSFNHLSYDILAIMFMDVISPTRFVKVHPSFMEYGNYLNNHYSRNTGTK